MVYNSFALFAAASRASPRARKAAIQLTERAAEQIKTLLAKRNQASLLKDAVPSKGGELLTSERSQYAQ
jgi:hypothetical protein